MIRIIIKRPDGEIIDERIDGMLKDGKIFDDAPNGGVIIRLKDRKYIIHISNVCIIETPDN